MHGADSLGAYDKQVPSLEQTAQGSESSCVARCFKDLGPECCSAKRMSPDSKENRLQVQETV